MELRPPGEAAGLDTVAERCVQNGVRRNGVREATISVAALDCAGKLTRESVIETRAVTILEFAARMDLYHAWFYPVALSNLLAPR